MILLREYKPEECDEDGIPLDWEVCRNCQGTGKAFYDKETLTCGACDGHGSLKAAALASKTLTLTREQVIAGKSPVGGFTRAQLAAWGVPWPPPKGWRRRLETEGVARCEGCGHPASEGTWEKGASRPTADDLSMMQRTGQDMLVVFGEKAGTWKGIHYSPCDEGCRHGGPVFQRGPRGAASYDELPPVRDGFEASWRVVDVRTGQPAPAGHPHPMIWTRPWDLRLENLRVLCLRCWSQS